MMTCNAETHQLYIEIPAYVQEILDALTTAGHEAYIVGGCVRDALMGRRPEDWDVCTSALPEETKAVFAEEKTIDTGIAHGTVTVVQEPQSVEITTYRIDGEYEDGRHPKEVVFTRSLKEDLARRDFTMNAMAYHPDKGVIDLYGGRDDLQNGLIRCVGEPAKRFREDALRIMRGLRFAATMGFDIEPATANAMDAEKDGLETISKERINVELTKLLLGDEADPIVNHYMNVLEMAAPGIRLPKTALQQLPKNPAIRLAEVFPKDTARYLRQLKYDGNTTRWARVLSRLKDTPAPIQQKKEMVRFLQKHGEIITVLHYARAGETEVVALGRLLEQKPCYRLQDLDISGNDLMEMGMQSGPAMGDVLKKLLDLVIEEEIKNERDALLAAAKEEIAYE